MIVQLFSNIAAKRVEKRSMLRVLLATYIHALQRIRLLAGCESLLLCMLRVLPAQGKLFFICSK